MKIKNLKYLAFVAVLGLGMSSCSDFLDKPAEDSYNTGTFYKNDAQCIQGVNYLYNSPWYDFQRGFFKVGEVLSGNYYWGSSPYLTFTLKSTDEDLRNMSYSLWAVNGHCNVVYGYLKSATASAAVKNQCMGECLAWKAMAYFYLVRTFGDVPIIHDNTQVIAQGSYNDQYKVQKADVYEYIVMTLEKAIELLPAKSDAGRIDKYCAEGLLAKVYLTKSGLGQNGSRNQSDLDMAAKYAKDVIDHSGRQLMPNYSDIFRLANNNCAENMIAWRWTVEGENWTRQNTLQSDLAMVGFDEFGDTWGGWNGPSVDLQDAFGVKATDNPSNRTDVDTRRKATMMLAGDKYDYFWADKGGFDFLRFIYDSNDYGKGGPGGSMQCATGSNEVKHLYGNNNDHKLGTGFAAQNMASSLCTPILRLADVYLIYAEAVLGNSASTSDASALAAFNAVRGRAIPGFKPYTSITFDDVWKERRLELACEGDRWYDYVRLSYYNMNRAISEIKSQRRNTYLNLDDLYKGYYEKKQWNYDATKQIYDTSVPVPNVTAESFTIPFPQEDLVFNKHLSEDAIYVDIRNTYGY